MKIHPSHIALYLCLFLAFTSVPACAQPADGGEEGQIEEVTAPVWLDRLSDKERRDLKTLVDRYCPSFAQNVDLLPAVTDADMVDCSYISGDTGEIKARCYPVDYHDFTQKPPRKETRFYTAVTGSGTCRSTRITELSQQTTGKLLFRDVINTDINGYGFGSDDVILHSYSTRPLVSNEGRGDLRVLLGDGAYVLCGFENRLLGWQVTGWSRAAVCEEFANDDFSYPESTKPDSFALEKEIYGADLPKETHIDSRSLVDLDNDGKAEEVLTLSYSSGRGCGCGFTYLTLPQRPENAKMNAKLADLIGEVECGRTGGWSVVVIGGKTYIAHKAQKIETDNKERLILEAAERVLYAYENSHFTEICRAKPLTKRVISHEVLKPGQLMYAPIP
ncbi:MAG: hypothetical protein Q8K65_01550 [Alphaproteobacteria bacterium]|nr:hypothetical protein [Alphaproteobacteria bacterium]